ncbi:MAG TPA: hypothetical protein VLC09_03145 [Polyangiaceae bacterium]|nr:hypothetical protein [Polyangiaceae bacterium]
MAKVIGRKVLPTDINEEYVLQQLGVEHVLVPRKLNPYFVARRLTQAARPCPHHDFLYRVVSRLPLPKPGSGSGRGNGGAPPVSTPAAPAPPSPEAFGEAAE